MLFYCKDPEMFCVLRNFTWLYISVEGGEDDWGFNFGRTVPLMRTRAELCMSACEQLVTAAVSVWLTHYICKLNVDTVKKVKLRAAAENQDSAGPQTTTRSLHLTRLADARQLTAGVAVWAAQQRGAPAAVCLQLHLVSNWLSCLRKQQKWNGDWSWEQQRARVILVVLSDTVVRESRVFSLWWSAVAAYDCLLNSSQLL